MSERWRPIPGFEGSYEASDLGRVRSLDRWVNGVHIPGVYMKGYPDSNGRIQVTLRKNGKAYHRRVHILVLEAFVGPPPPGMVGCHWDDDRSNNRLPNLRWATRTDNNDDCVRNGHHFNASKTHCKHGHPFDKNTRVYTKKNGRRVRVCRECQKANFKKQWERRKANGYVKRHSS